MTMIKVVKPIFPALSVGLCCTVRSHTRCESFDETGRKCVWQIRGKHASAVRKQRVLSRIDLCHLLLVHGPAGSPVDKSRTIIILFQ